jgi:cytochrome c biogenesis protein CcdA
VLHVTEKLNQYVDQNSKYIDDNNRFKADYDTNLDIITSIARSRAIIYFMIGIVIVFFYLRIAPTTEEYALGIPYETIRAIAVIMMVSMGTLHSLWFEMRSQSSQGPLQSWDTSPAWKLLATASIALVFCSLLWHNTRIEA